MAKRQLHFSTSPLPPLSDEQEHHDDDDVVDVVAERPPALTPNSDSASITQMPPPPNQNNLVVVVASSSPTQTKPTSQTTPPPPVEETQIDDHPQSKRPASEIPSDKLSSKNVKLNLMPFQKIWSQDDEISLLTSATAFIDGTGARPSDDSAAFYKFAKKYLANPDFTNAQVSTKLRKLRDKHSKNALKETEGTNIVFPDAHAKKVYELSKCLWGVSKPEAEGLAPGLRQRKKQRVENVNKENTELGLGFGLLCGREDPFVDNGFKSLEGKKRREFEKRWVGLTIRQLELNVERATLIVDQKKALLKAAKKKLKTNEP